MRHEKDRGNRCSCSGCCKSDVQSGDATVQKDIDNPFLVLYYT